MKLNDKLNALESYPLHMPGHKRNPDFNIPCSDIDITEIDGFDNLHSPKGILADLQQRLKKLYRSTNTIISVNGSTCGILSAVSAVSNKGDTIIIARNCHKSVYNACYINELNIVYIEPEFNSEFGCFGKITQEKIDNAITQNPNACAVVITSPTYEGIVSNIKCNIPLIIDAAHGAHFGFANWLPEIPNGDIVVTSLHKTLPALTQSAAVNIYNEKYISSVKKYMDIFETSSPSYVLMSSVEKCTDFLENCNKSFSNYKKLLDYFYSEINKIKSIHCLKNDDITRIVLRADGCNGVQLAEHLREYKIEPEAVMNSYVILISTVADTKEGFEKLIFALKNLKKRSDIQYELFSLEIPKKYCNPFEVVDFSQTCLSDASGKVSAEYIFAYPPGSPIIVPGEIITDDVVNFIKKSIKNGVNIISESNLLPSKILTKE